MASNENQQQQQPSLLGGHAEYAKGATQAAIGSVTGSQPWTASGEQAKAHAVADMKAAGEAVRGQGQGQQEGQQGSYVGKAEALAGRAVGCEGMAKEGSSKQE